MQGGILGTIAQLLGRPPLYMLLYVALIVFFAFFYTAIVFNPTETTDNLQEAWRLSIRRRREDRASTSTRC